MLQNLLFDVSDLSLEIITEYCTLISDTGCHDIDCEVPAVESGVVHCERGPRGTCGYGTLVDSTDGVHDVP